MEITRFNSEMATESRDIWQWDAWQIADAIADGTISSREAVTSCLQRIEASNPRINAFSHVNTESALHAADTADAARASGQKLGPLHGVPVSIKCNIDVLGEPTTNGVVARRDDVARAHSPVVSNLLNSGAVIVGRTNAPAFSFRWFTENDLHGRTLNPWNDELTPGGSSGGAGAAVAAGMCPIAHGNDIAGSIRYPAYACGLAGLRPTAGRIPSFTPSGGDVRTFSSQHFAVQGPIARSVRDLRISLAAMSTRDVRDPDWIPAQLTGDIAKGPIKVALVDDFDGLPLAPEVRAALERAAQWLSEEGYIVERKTPPGLKEALDVWMTIAMTELGLGYAPLIEQYGDDGAREAVRAMYARSGKSTTLEDYIRAFAKRDGLRRQWNAFFEQYPVMLMPTSLQLPFKYGLDLAGDKAMSDIMDEQLPMMAIAALNYPGLSVPTGLHGDVPVGVQIVAGAFREDLCLSAGESIERHACMPRAFG
ncbi:amidase family protein [Paraburkholderia caffeinilytica]|uniref:amidase family protein n=1 Tax=Paraburkholderia caffeinilytica TaxID=1761016 RepID=UPI0038BD39EE